MGKVLFSFDIPGRLPGLNQYVNACRTHWAKGAKMKKQIEETISYCIFKAKAKGQQPVSVPCVIEITWHERVKNRDADNIQSSQKFILDALKNCRIIPDDNRRWVKQVYHHIEDDDSDFVSVRILEA